MGDGMKISSDNALTYASAPRLELVGNSECIVDGLKGIIEYNSDRIRLNLGRYCVAFIGVGLRIESFSYTGAVIQGDIISMEYESNE